MYDPWPFSKRIYFDTCLTGLGGTFDNFVYTMQLSPGYVTSNIVHLEMLNVVVALFSLVNGSLALMCVLFIQIL